MSKVVKLLLSVLLCISFAGCASKNDKSSSTAKKNNGTPVAEMEGYKLAKANDGTTHGMEYQELINTFGKKNVTYQYDKDNNVIVNVWLSDARSTITKAVKGDKKSQEDWQKFVDSVQSIYSVVWLNLSNSYGYGHSFTLNVLDETKRNDNNLWQTNLLTIDDANITYNAYQTELSAKNAKENGDK